MRRKLISIICPVLNEEQALPIYYQEISRLAQARELSYAFEFVFTDNCSDDKTFQILTDLAKADSRVRVFRFSKNYGYQASIFTGYKMCRGDAAVQLDVDLQDPLEVVAEFITKWEQGFQVVYGIRTKRKESWALNQIRKIFYRALNFLSTEPIAVDAGDFRLVDRVIIENIKKMSVCLYLRGAIAQMGFKQIGVPYSRNARTVGDSKFGYFQLAALAIDSLLLHSTVPLRFATYFGVCLSAFTSFGAISYIMLKLIVGEGWPAGFTSVIVFVLLSLGINSLFLGILGEYVGRIYRQQQSPAGVIIEHQIEHQIEHADTPSEAPSLLRA